MLGGVFASALDVLFNDPNLATTGTLVSPSGVQTSVRVLLTTASDPVVGAAASYGADAQHDMAEILQSEVPGRPDRNSTLTLDDGTVYALSTMPQASKRGLTWRLVLSDG